MTSRRLRGLALPAVLVCVSAFPGCSMVPRAQGGNRGTISAGTARLDVQNNTGDAIYTMQASACSDTNWGPSRLGTSVISSGGAMSFDLTPGCWDFRADFDQDHSSGNELVQRNIQIGSGSSWTWTIGG